MASILCPGPAGHLTPRCNGPGLLLGERANETKLVKRLTIIGAGAWGTALSIVARRAGSTPVLWARDRAIVAAINERHENPLLLPGARLDSTIVATSDIDAATANAEAALLAIPAQFLRAAIFTLRS